MNSFTTRLCLLGVVLFILYALFLIQKTQKGIPTQSEDIGLRFAWYCGNRTRDLEKTKTCDCSDDLTGLQLKQDSSGPTSLNSNSKANIPLKPKFVGISFPKCGSTWLRVLIAYAVHLLHGKPERTLSSNVRANETIELLFGMFPTVRERYPIGRIYWVHENSPYDKTPETLAKTKNPKRYNTAKVIFLVRDPRDVVVSFFFHAKSKFGKQKFRRQVNQHSCRNVKSELAI